NSAGTWYFATGAGVYRSTDSGATWAKTSNGLPGGLVLNTAGGAGALFATSNTVYKSVDGGATWLTSDAGITGYTGINAGSSTGTTAGGSLVSSAAGVFVSTNNHGVFRSTDQGTSWSAVNFGLPPLVGQAPAVLGDPTNTSGLFAAFGNYPNGVYRSSDGGTSWQAISGNLAGNALYARFVAIDPKTGELYAATRGGLYKSANGGTTWTLQNNLTGACGASSVRVDSATQPSTIYWSARCIDATGAPTAAAGLYRSIDAGVNSTQLLAGENVANMRFTRIGTQVTLWVASWNSISSLAASPGLTSSAGRVLRSTDGGASWQELSAGLPIVLPRVFAANTSQVTRLTTNGTGMYSFFSGAADVTLPGLATNAAAVAAGSNQVSVSWTAATDDVAVTGYNVFRSAGGTGPFVLVGGVAGTAFSDASVAPSSGYTYAVAACDAAGNCSPLSTPSALVTTPAASGHALSVSVSGSGGVTSDSGGIDCQGGTGTCAANFAPGTQVTLNATPGTGYAFSGWSGACTNSSGACTVTMNSPLSVTASFVPGQALPLNTTGFNLTGNGTTAALDVVALFGTADNPVPTVSANVDAVWSWHAIPAGSPGAPGRWRFHTPQLTAAQSAAYAAANGYEVLTTVPAGEGFWVNVYQPINVVTPSGAPFNYGTLNFPALPGGFNLLSIGLSRTALQFANGVGAPPTPPESVSNSFNALWAWDAARGRWYFFAPSLELTGSPFNSCTYAANQNYLDFGGCAAANDKLGVPNRPAPALTLEPGMGFWVEKY
ncbi:MAG: exo-alpha-sialidase, partial [Burkholderiales bacterium]|nr:exo-alpha-sialidase [Burkholderiales bacterium]